MSDRIARAQQANPLIDAVATGAVAWNGRRWTKDGWVSALKTPDWVAVAERKFGWERSK